jgi:hypothetical protein
VQRESARIIERVAADEWNEPRHYGMLTNVVLTASLREQVSEGFKRALPDCNVIAWGGQDISDFLDDSPRVRAAFPQILGLRDLNQILSEVLLKAVHERSRAQLDKAGSLARVFVPTRAYYDALLRLQKHNFVVLTGPPEMGKTTIGLIIGLGKANDGWDFIDCSNPKDFLDARNSDRTQLFLVDDAFGSTEYRPDLALPWADHLEKVLHRVDPTHWLIWTSRPAPLHAALQSMNLEGCAEGFPRPADVSVNSSELSIQEKALILYRHAKAAQLAPSAKTLLKKNLLAVVGNPHFTPERIRRFVSDVLPSLASAESLTVGALTKRIEAEIATPTRRMRTSFDKLKTAERDLLVSLLDAAPGTVSEHDLEHAFARHSTEGGAIAARKIAEMLSDHFIRVGGRNG